MTGALYRALQSEDYRKRYKAMGKASGAAWERALYDRCAVLEHKDRMRTRGVQTFTFAADAARQAGAESMALISDPRDPDRVLNALSTVAALREPVYIECSLPDMLAGVTGSGGRMASGPEPAEDVPGLCGFVYTPTATGEIDVMTWTAAVLPGATRPTVMRDTLDCVLGGPGDLTLRSLGMYTHLPMGLTSPVPALAGYGDLLGVRHSEVEKVGFTILSRLDPDDHYALTRATLDRAGVARRALTLLYMVMRPPETLALTEPTTVRGQSRHTGRGWEARNRDVVLRLHRRPRGTDSPGPSTGRTCAQHAVRGHWRHIGDQCGDHVPQWIDKGYNRQTCDTCGARRTFIPTHTRGSAEVGVIRRTGYKVTV